MMETSTSAEAEDPLPITNGEADFIAANNKATENGIDNDDAYSHVGTVDGDVEEGRDTILTAEDTVERTNRALRKKCFIIIALVLVIGGLVALIVGLVVSQNNNNNEPASGESSNMSNETPNNEALDGMDQTTPTLDSEPASVDDTSTATPPDVITDPEDPNAKRLSDTIMYLIDNDISTTSSLQDITSPQYQTAVWMSQQDPKPLEIPTSNNYQFNQRYSLAVLYYALSGEGWAFDMKWLSGRHECEWYTSLFLQSGFTSFGVYCDGEPDLEDPDADIYSKQRTVTTLDFPPENNMIGNLPSELRHLKYLKSLHIEQNEGIVGSIPEEYGEMENLRYFGLVYTKLTGKIPRSFGSCKKLNSFILENNELTSDSTEGDLDFLNEMTSLVYLALDYNPITGTIPDLSALTKLQMLSVPNTNMFGTLPQSLSKLTELRLLFLDDCNFDGSIDMLMGMTNLTHIYLEDNHFDNTMDDTSFAELEKLVHLDVSNCSFSGNIPGHLFNISSLEVIDMSDNSLEGELPAQQLSDVQESALKFLSLHSNKLTGAIPPSISNLKSLITLDLSMNEFSDDIPSEIGDLERLSILFLGRNEYNELALDDAQWLKNLTSLTELSLKSSNLIQTIPDWLGSSLSKLLFLDLAENALTGTIPQSLQNMTDLTVLILNQNQLTGQLGLGDLIYLEVLIVDDNSLTGNTDDVCVHTITHFVSDCGGGSEEPFEAELTCECCTLCCNDSNVTCNDSEWLGNAEGIWEFGFDRVRWAFDDGMISPFVNYNYQQSVESSEAALAEGVEGP